MRGHVCEWDTCHCRANRLKAKLDRLKTGRTQFCIQCEHYAKQLAVARNALKRIASGRFGVMGSEKEAKEALAKLNTANLSDAKQSSGGVAGDIGGKNG